MSKKFVLGWVDSILASIFLPLLVSFFRFLRGFVQRQRILQPFERAKADLTNGGRAILLNGADERCRGHFLGQATDVLQNAVAWPNAGNVGELPAAAVTVQRLVYFCDGLIGIVALDDQSGVGFLSALFCFGLQI